MGKMGGYTLLATVPRYTHHLELKQMCMLLFHIPPQNPHPNAHFCSHLLGGAQRRAESLPFMPDSGRY